MSASFPIQGKGLWGRFGSGTAAALLRAAALLVAGQAQGQAQAPAGLPAPSFTGLQLDQMLAPIALYPDGLLGQILMAATYPLEIVEADRWLQDPDNATLGGAQLVQAMQQQAWDPSVKSLVAFPQVLGVLDGNLDWTEQLGEAFIAQQREVMDHVQQLRGRAQAARTLISTPQQVVSGAGGDIEIAPPDTGTLYVPVYDPNLVFGGWPYPDAPPYYFDMAGVFPGAFVGFVIVAPLWGWDQCDWRNHGIVVTTASGAAAGSGRPQVHHVPWRHDPAHRGGVQYGNNAVQTRAGGAPAGSSLPAQTRSYRPERFPASPAAYPTARPAAPAVQNAPGGSEPARAVNRAAFAPITPPRAAQPAPAAPPATPEWRAHAAEQHVPDSRGAEIRGAEAHESANANGGRDRR